MERIIPLDLILLWRKKWSGVRSSTVYTCDLSVHGLIRVISSAIITIDSVLICISNPVFFLNHMHQFDCCCLFELIFLYLLWQQISEGKRGSKPLSKTLDSNSEFFLDFWIYFNSNQHGNYCSTHEIIPLSLFVFHFKCAVLDYKLNYCCPGLQRHSLLTTYIKCCEIFSIITSTFRTLVPRFVISCRNTNVNICINHNVDLIFDSLEMFISINLNHYRTSKNARI